MEEDKIVSKDEIVNQPGRPYVDVWQEVPELSANFLDLVPGVGCLCKRQ